MRKIRQPSWNWWLQTTTTTKKKKRKCPTLKILALFSIYMHKHNIFGWDEFLLLLLLFRTDTYTRAHVYIHGNIRSHSNSRTYKKRYTLGISRCLNNKWKFAPLTHIHTYIHRQSSSDEHPQTHTYTLIHFTNILMRWWWWKNLQMKKKSIFPSLFGKWCTNTQRFRLYIWNISEFMRKKKHVHWNVSLDDVVGIAKIPNGKRERNPNLAKMSGLQW